MSVFAPIAGWMLLDQQNRTAREQQRQRAQRGREEVRRRKRYDDLDKPRSRPVTEQGRFRIIDGVEWWWNGQQWVTVGKPSNIGNTNTASIPEPVFSDSSYTTSVVSPSPKPVVTPMTQRDLEVRDLLKQFGKKEGMSWDWKNKEEDMNKDTIIDLAQFLLRWGFEFTKGLTPTEVDMALDVINAIIDEMIDTWQETGKPHLSAEFIAPWERKILNTLMEAGLRKGF